jgi:hypothetical protein
MSIGDLLHPEERMLPAEQIAIVVDHASRWYTAHLLLYVGILLFIPGFLGLRTLTARLKPVQGYVAADSDDDRYCGIRLDHHR